MKNIKVGSIVKVNSINFKGRVMVVSVERNIVTARKIDGTVISTHIRNIREDK